MNRKYICPSCKEKAGVNILYGMPSDEAVKKADLGEIALGGCVVEESQPERRCNACGAEWHIKHRMPTLFMRAKAKWVKKVRGKSWTQLTHESEQEIDAKVADLMTPEYIAKWGKVR